MRKASTTMSWVADAVATRTAAAKTTSQWNVVGLHSPSRTMVSISNICVNTSQPRRRPSQRENNGASSASVSGAQRNFTV